MDTAAPTHGFATPGGNPHPGLSEVSRLTGVFFEPKKAFTDIAARPRWIVPLVLIALSSFAISLVFSQRGLVRLAVEQQMANNSQMQQLPTDQREQRTQVAVKVAGIIAYSTPILIPIVYSIIALVLWAIAAGILSAPVRFKQVFAIVCYAELPALVKAILTVIVVSIKNPADVNMQNPLLFNPGAFMDPLGPSKFVYTAATWLDLFNIWIVLLIATGLKAAAGKKLSFGGALFAVLLPWAVVILAASAFASLTS